MSEASDIERLAGLLRLAARSVTLLEEQRLEGSECLRRAALQVLAAADLLDEDAAEPTAMREARAFQ